ncbi:MAG: hypothetical protein CMG80_17295 [Marinobacter sp.]|nr:hypothetical protein [Marinobacter sp.]
MNVKEHDPALALGYIDTKIAMSDAFCEDYDSLENAYYQSVWLYEYSLFTNDPQLKTAGNIKKDIDKAMEYSDDIRTCERFLKLANLKLLTLKKAWGSR